MVLGSTQDRGLVSTFHHVPLISQRVTAFGDQPVSLTSVFKRVDLQQKLAEGEMNNKERRDCGMKDTKKKLGIKLNDVVCCSGQ